MHSIEDYNKFVSAPMKGIDKSEIMHLSGYDDKDSFNKFVEDKMNDNEFVKATFEKLFN